MLALALALPDGSQTTDETRRGDARRGEARRLQCVKYCTGLGSNTHDVAACACQDD